jgi:C4-dicarboxylate-specific signal transduction histidine kinase
MVRHQIVMQRADVELTLTLLDTKLVIHGNDTRLEQEFPSTAALVEHALRVVKLRQAEGYRVTAERKDDQIVIPPEPEPTPERAS